MKNTYITIIILIVLSLQAKGQSAYSRTDFDTIEVYNNSVLVNFVTYTESIITEEGQAFLYRDSIEIRKSKWLPRFFKKTVPVDRIVLHGIVKSQWKEGKYRIGKYDNGEKLEMAYFDSEGNEISYQEFYRGFRSHSDPEEGTNLYIIHGTKKKKK